MGINECKRLVPMLSWKLDGIPIPFLMGLPRVSWSIFVSFSIRNLLMISADIYALLTGCVFFDFLVHRWFWLIDGGEQRTALSGLMTRGSTA